MTVAPLAAEIELIRIRLKALYKSVVCGIFSIRDHEP